MKKRFILLSTMVVIFCIFVVLYLIYLTQKSQIAMVKENQTAISFDPINLSVSNAFSDSPASSSANSATNSNAGLENVSKTETGARGGETTSSSMKAATTTTVTRWKMYKNEVFGIQFEYPDNWAIGHLGSSTQLFGPLSGTDRDFIVNSFSLNSYNSSEFNSLEALANAQAGLSDNGQPEKIKLESITLDGASAIKIVSLSREYPIRWVFFNKDKAFVIWDIAGSNASNWDHASPELSHLLSTIKIIK